MCGPLNQPASTCTHTPCLPAWHTHYGFQRAIQGPWELLETLVEVCEVRAALWPLNVNIPKCEHWWTTARDEWPMLPSKASSSRCVLNTPLSLTDTRNVPSLTDLSMFPSLQNYSHLHTNLLLFILINKKSLLSTPLPLPATPHLPIPLCTNFLKFLSSHLLSPLPYSSGSPHWGRQTPSVQFSRSVVSNSLWPHGLQHARLPCPSPSPGACSNSCPLCCWCHPTISSSVVPFSSCLQSFPASVSFPMS